MNYPQDPEPDIPCYSDDDNADPADEQPEPYGQHGAPF